MKTPAVNPPASILWHLPLLVGLFGGCHLGRPPGAAAFTLGAAAVASVEPGLSAAIQAAFVQALAARPAPGVPRPVDLRLDDEGAVVEAAGADGAQIIALRARLEVAPALPGVAPLVVRAEERYTQRPGDPRAAADARAAAWSRLCQRLAQVAVRWLDTLEGA